MKRLALQFLCSLLAVTGFGQIYTPGSGGSGSSTSGTNTFAQIQLAGTQAWNTNMAGGVFGFFTNMTQVFTNGMVAYGSTGAVQTITAGWYNISYSCSYIEAAGQAIMRLDVFTNIAGASPVSIDGGVHDDVNAVTFTDYVAPGIMRYLPANCFVTVAQGYITGSGGGTLSNATISVMLASGTVGPQGATGAAGSPAGSSGAVQFNQGGVFDGTNDLVWNRTNRVLTLTNNASTLALETISIGAPAGGVQNGAFYLFASGAVHWFLNGSGNLLPATDGTESLGIIGFEPKQILGKSAFFGTLNVRTNIYLTNNIGLRVSQVTGVGGANTNFTLQAQGANSVIYMDAGTTNVNIVAIMGYDSAFAWRGSVILTNRTATARALSLGATTNNWISLQQFDGITAPFTVTNSQAGRLEWEILGTNVQYSYKPMALPSN